MGREAVAVCQQCHHALDEANKLKMKRKRPYRALFQFRVLDPDVGPPDPKSGGLPEGRTLTGTQQMYDFCSEQCRKLWVSAKLSVYTQQEQ